MLKKIILYFVLVSIIICALSMSSFAAGDNTTVRRVFDEGNYFSVSEIATLEKKAQELYEESGVDILIITAKSGFNVDKQLRYYNIPSGDKIVLTLTRDTEYRYDIHTYGDSYDKFSDAEIDRILDNPGVYDNIKSGKFLDGYINFMTLTAKAYTGLLWADTWKTVAVGIVVGAVMLCVVAFSIIGSYKKKLKSTSYPLNAYTKLDLKFSDDQFMGSFVTKTRINTSSGSGGSRGGSRGSAHRGGR